MLKAVAIRTTVVPIREDIGTTVTILIRTTVVPLSTTIRTTENGLLTGLLTIAFGGKKMFTFLTLSQTSPGFYVSAVEVF